MRITRGILLLGLILVLTSCLGPKPALVVVEPAEGKLELSSGEENRPIIIQNVGEEGSVLNWRIESSSPLITASPTSGSLPTGSMRQGILIYINQSPLSKGQRIEETLTLRSNGGTEVVEISFLMTVDGLGACGTYPSDLQEARGGQAEAERADGPFVPGELLVQYRSDGLTAQSASMQQQVLNGLELAVAEHFDLQLLKRATPYRPGLVRVGAGEDPHAAARRLEADPRVAYAEPNYYLEPLAVPNDPELDEQWNLLEFGLPDAWELETGDGAEVVVAIIDSGVDMLHEDLVDKMLPGCDFYDGDNDPNTRNNHGTHVAGIAAAVGNNGKGVAGVAHGSSVRILPIKIFPDVGGQSSIDKLLDAMLWAAGLPVEGAARNPHKAHVINISLGADVLDNDTLRAIDDVAQRVHNEGIIQFGASGNAGLKDRIFAPANSPWIYAVGSIDDDYRLSAFSNYDSNGPSVDFVAPGGLGSSFCGSVFSTILDDNYYCLQGTSMATPFVSGVAALLLSQTPELSVSELEAKLRTSAFFESSYMTSAAYGSGVVCADRALGATTRCGR